MSREDTLRFLTTREAVIAPSMLKCDYGNLDAEIRSLEAAGAEVLHWDVMDGHFVPNLSYGAMMFAPLRSRTKLLFDAHLMISQPAKYLADYLAAGCDIVTIHAEAEGDIAGLLDEIRQADRVAGLAINPETPISAVQTLLPLADYILVMSVRPGFGGQSFMPEVLPKFSEIKGLGRGDAVLAIDGGIAEATIGRASAAGASYHVVGSAIFDEDDYTLAIRRLNAAAIAGHAGPPSA